MKQDEFTPLPREFGADPPEFAPPGPEFGGHAPGAFPRRRKKRLAAAAAAALLLAPLVLPQATPTAAPAPSETIAAPTEPASAPMETVPAPSETLPPETVPVGPPTCSPIFFAFSDALRGRLVFTNPDAILSVRAELWDSLGESMEQTWEVPPEAIARGEYDLPDMMGMYDMYMAHHESYDPTDPFPVPQLRVSMTYLDGERETTQELTQSCTEEQGWSVRAADGEIRFRTYEAFAPITLRVGEDPETLESGALLVAVQINGEAVPPDRCEISQDEDTWFTADGESITFHYASLTVPQQGASGEALVTVYQKLQGYDTLWSETVRVAY